MQVHGKLQAMFEDSLQDVMEELWSAFQYAASKQSVIRSLHNAMTQRDAELEAVANKRWAVENVRAV